MNKAELRQIYKKKRTNLSVQETRIYNQAIFHHLISLDWSSYTSVHVYLEIGQFNEPNTALFIEYLQEHYPAIKIIISKTDFKTSTMTHYIFNDDTVLKRNPWGIMEPIAGVEVHPSEIDVVLVPLLVVDKLGNRVGFGKGFYDRFLSQCKSDVKTIGVSYFDPVDRIDDVNKYDIPIQSAVIPSGFINFS